MPADLALTASEQLAAAVAELAAGVGPTSSAAENMAAMRAAVEARNALDRILVDGTANLQQLGTFAEQGYRSPAAALADVFGWERFEARRHVVAAESVCPTVSLTGETMPARLPATAMVFGSGEISLRHVETIARLLSSGAGRRLEADVWASAEAELATQAASSTPTELHHWGTRLIDALDQDGPEPDDGAVPDQINELHVRRFTTRPGGRIEGRYDDAVMFDAIAAVIDAGAAPRDPDDQRATPERQAEALAEACAQVLAQGRLPETGGRRPQMVVTVGLDELERRVASAFLEFGGQLTPQALRQMACDAAVIPMVLDSVGVPLDVGRASRTIPEGIRRAVTTRDEGCAHPGCDRPPSWSEIHHVIEWQHGGPTSVNNLVMLCRVHHRLVHQSGWEIRMVEGHPEFIPPYWVDRHRTPRRRQPVLRRAG